jgi:hypothetical protein
LPCNSDDDHIPDYRDIDSDNDNAPDLIEAGDQDLTTPPQEGNDDNDIPAFRDPNDIYMPLPPTTGCKIRNDPLYKGILPWGFNRGVVCGLELIRNTLANAGFDVGDDPPVPDMLLVTTPGPLPDGGATTQVNAIATHSTTSLYTSLITSHTVLYGGLNTTWTSDTWLGAQFTTLSTPQAELYDEQDNLIATGAVQVQPADNHTAVALALGDTLTYTIKGNGNASFYALATSGLGVGGTWQTYTAQVQSATTYGVGLQGAIVSVDGQQYSGALTLVTSDPVTLQGYGRTLAPNFSQQAAIQASDASVRVGGSATIVPGAERKGNQRLSLAGYTGSITITEHTSELDLVELDGLAARDLSLATTPEQSSITPLETAVFQTDISSNQDDTYTVTVAPPWGWQAQINASGQITITPPLAMTIPSSSPPNPRPSIPPIRCSPQPSTPSPSRPTTACNWPSPPTH